MPAAICLDTFEGGGGACTHEPHNIGLKLCYFTCRLSILFISAHRHKFDADSHKHMFTATTLEGWSHWVFPVLGL